MRPFLIWIRSGADGFDSTQNPLAGTRVSHFFDHRHHKEAFDRRFRLFPGEMKPCPAIMGSRCLIPRFDGAILSLEWKDALWDKFVTEAPRPRTLSEQQYSDRRLRSRS